MNSDSVATRFEDSTQELTIRLPCRLVHRAMAYAREADTSIEGLVIEALDLLLRNRNNWEKSASY